MDQHPLSDARKDMLLAAYSQMQENLRTIRARMHTNVQLAVTLFAVGSAFFLSADAPPKGGVRIVAALGFLMLGLVLGFVQRAQQATVVDIFSIQTRLEIAMGFHARGAYIPDETLYPTDFASGATRGTRGLVKYYDTIIFGSAILAAAATFLA